MCIFPAARPSPVLGAVLPPRPASLLLVPTLLLAVLALPGPAQAAEGRNAAVLGGVAGGVLGGLAAGVLLGAPPPPRTRVIIPDPVIVHERAPRYEVEEEEVEERVVERRRPARILVEEDEELACRVEHRRTRLDDGAIAHRRVEVCD